MIKAVLIYGHKNGAKTEWKTVLMLTDKLQENMENMQKAAYKMPMSPKIPRYVSYVLGVRADVELANNDNRTCEHN